MHSSVKRMHSELLNLYYVFKLSPRIAPVGEGKEHEAGPITEKLASTQHHMGPHGKSMQAYVCPREVNIER